MKQSLLLCVALTALSVSGCFSGLTQIQDSVAKFGQAASSISSAEMNFFQAVKTADCNSQFFTTAYNQALGTGNFDISGSCTPSILSDQQLKIRQSLMDALTLYAAKMSALATSDDNKALDSNAQALATKLNSLAKQGGFSGLAVASDVEAGIIAITNMVLDQTRFSDLKQAAGAMQVHLSAVVGALKTENIAFAEGINSKVEKTEGEVREVLAATHNTRRQMTFFDMLEARRIVQSMNTSDPKTVVFQLNATLDSLLNANEAIATAGTGGIVAAVNDLIARAQAAQAMAAALNK